MAVCLKKKKHIISPGKNSLGNLLSRVSNGESYFQRKKVTIVMLSRKSLIEGALSYCGRIPFQNWGCHAGKKCACRGPLYSAISVRKDVEAAKVICANCAPQSIRTQITTLICFNNLKFYYKD